MFPAALLPGALIPFFIEGIRGMWAGALSGLLVLLCVRCVRRTTNAFAVVYIYMMQ